MEAIARDYWNEFGRHYYTRYDYEGVETAQADALMDGLRGKIVELAGKTSKIKRGEMRRSGGEGSGNREDGRV